MDLRALPGCGISSAPSSYGARPAAAAWSPPGSGRCPGCVPRLRSRRFCEEQLTGAGQRPGFPHRCAALPGSPRSPDHPRAAPPRELSASREYPGTLPDPETIPKAETPSGPQHPRVYRDLPGQSRTALPETPLDPGTPPDPHGPGPLRIPGYPRTPGHPGTSALPDPPAPGPCRTPNSPLTSAPRLPPASGPPRTPGHPGTSPPPDPGTSPPLHPGTSPVLCSPLTPPQPRTPGPRCPRPGGPGPDYNSRRSPGRRRRLPPFRSRHGAVRAGGAARAAPGLLPAALPARPLRPLAQLRRR